MARLPRSLTLIFLVAGIVLYKPVFAEKGKLDMSSLQVDFREGELDIVKNLLESFLKNQVSTATRDEKIFAYKYLGVIYASNATSRKKAESYFNQLLPLAPNIELTDMFVSKEIQTVFDEVKRDYLHSQDYNSNFDSFGNPKWNGISSKGPQVENPEQNTAKRSPKSWLWWTAGLSVAAVGTGVALWVMEPGSKDPGTHHDGTIR